MMKAIRRRMDVVKTARGERKNEESAMMNSTS